MLQEHLGFSLFHNRNDHDHRYSMRLLSQLDTRLRFTFLRHSTSFEHSIVAHPPHMDIRSRHNPPAKPAHPLHPAMHPDFS